MPYFSLYIPVKGNNGSKSSSSSHSAANNNNEHANGNAAAPAKSSNAVLLSATGANNFAAGTVVDGASDTHAEAPLHVYREKSEALKVLKQLKQDARLREFHNEEDAIKYAETGYEVVQTRYADAKASNVGLEKAAFRAPSKQELVEFRKTIEAGNYERVRCMIWDNPRYLVSSGDTPTTLKEGYRYNAMHVCALSKKPQIAQLILQTVSDPQFVDMLTGKRNDEKMCRELCANLLDYYLNIPEKGRSETPLHLAAKTGAVEMIEVLTSYPECKMTKNSEGLLPNQIICTRLNGADAELVKRIATLLEQRYYVPVLRCMDDAIPPQVGDPFSTNNPPNYNLDPLSPEIKIQALAGPMNQEQAQTFCRRWKTPPRNDSGTLLNTSLAASPRALQSTPLPSHTPRSFNLTVESSTDMRKYQGRALFNNSNSLACDSSSDTLNGNNSQSLTTQATQATELLETNNNHQQALQSALSGSGAFLLQHKLSINTPMLQRKKDLFFNYRDTQTASPIVFDEHNNCSNNSMVAAEHDLFDSPGYKERRIKITDPEKGLEVIGRQLAKDQKICWREYWDFLNAFIDISSLDGLQKFEQYLAKRVRLADESKKINLDEVRNVLAELYVGNTQQDVGAGGDHHKQQTQQQQLRGHRRVGSDTATLDLAVSAPQANNPYNCVEKSLQVYAKRMTKTIVHNIDNVVTINDTLLSELKRLKSLICSFKEDARFLNVQFNKVHSRIGHLIAIYINNSLEAKEQEAKPKLQQIMQNLLLVPGARREHMECVCQRILQLLQQPTAMHALPENVKTELMCVNIWMQEKDCDCQWQNNLKENRKTSRLSNRFKTRLKAAAADDAAGGNIWSARNNAAENSDDEDDDIFYSGTDTEDDDQHSDIWYTPQTSPSLLSLNDEEPNVKQREANSYKIYIYGNEPTKRDVDVLNAIHVLNIDKQKYPHIHAWKTAITRYSSDDLKGFPSPAVVKKSHAIVAQKTHVVQRGKLSWPLKSPQIILTSPSPVKLMQTELQPQLIKQEEQLEQQPQQQESLPIAKRLFFSPMRSKPMNSFITPINKMRGLFSQYREHNDEPSPTILDGGAAN